MIKVPERELLPPSLTTLEPSGVVQQKWKTKSYLQYEWPITSIAEISVAVGFLFD